jgi:hypothetical protein
MSSLWLGPYPATARLKLFDKDDLSGLRRGINHLACFAWRDQMTDQPDFDRHWLSGEPSSDSSADSGSMPDIKAIREYAYYAFDHLDKNGNGFLERDELLAVLNSQITQREKSFITFLLNNQENIADMVKESGGAQSEGISRGDLESYFSLITALLC